ncbi:hypothetical protein FHG66_15070 [Rubellimicrobium rubrum]|uniref:Inner membrane protein n=1 Tax=Rubellimicrobium rubrum TaxID=2585369 RepID=A0A5C4MQR5_9RHOB|nr:hypothetical protein [Rubellimicrobium rubrum]TNC48192.1 hypothetical protein FHG66_15070 [Rubellimicrobium rubrum]
MARKAGPDDGAEVAPEGSADIPPADRNDVASESSVASFTEERAPESMAPNMDPVVQADQASRAEAVSEEGLGVLRLGEPLVSTVSENRPRHVTPEPVMPNPVEPDPIRPASLATDSMGPNRLQDAKDTSEAVGTGASRPVDEPSETTGAAARPQTPDRVSGTGFPSVAPTGRTAPVPPRRRGGFGALLLGGMIAAALGFGAAWLAQDRLGLFPARLPADLDARLAELEARPVPDNAAISDVSGRLTDFEARLAALEQAPVPEPVEAVGTVEAPDLGPLREDLTQATEAAEARATALEERIAALEARPTEAPAGGDAPLGSLATPDAPPAEPTPAPPAAPSIDPDALRDEVTAALDPRLTETEAGLADTRSSLAEVQTALDQLEARLATAEAASATAAEQARAAQEATAEVEARAATAETQAKIGSALAALNAAIDAGQPLEAPLADLQAAGAEVPEPLARTATEGVPTLAALQDAFPEAARTALAAARDEGLLSDGDGVLGFLRGQLSVRSVTPREGDDPDAVLSRAESALSRGDLASTLSQVESLPEPVRLPMADWISQARIRVAAEAALADLGEAQPTPAMTPAD